MYVPRVHKQKSQKKLIVVKVVIKVNELNVCVWDVEENTQN